VEDREPDLVPKQSGRWRWVLAAVVVCVAVIVVLNLIPDIHDPTEGGVTAHIVNDSGHALFLAVCEDHACQHVASGGSNLAPGESLSQDIEPNTVVPFFTHDIGPGDPHPVRCLTLTVGRTAMTSYPLSELSPCR
jgi:hypothetical protein